MNNIDFDLYLKEIENEFAWQNLVFKLYSNKIEINDKDIDSQLNEVVKNQKDVTEYQLGEIEILLDESLNINEQIKEIKTQIKNIGFENTAIKFSTSSSAIEGGNIGWINSNAISSKVLNLINNLKIGEISDPFLQPKTITFKLLNKKAVIIDKDNIKRLRETIILNNKNKMLGMYSNNHLSKNKEYCVHQYKMIKNKIIIVAGDPNSINSEIIYKTWKKINSSIKRKFI